MPHRIEHRPHLSGHLEVYAFPQQDAPPKEFFTFSSLADVLGVPLTTLEGRYVRTGLRARKVDLPTMAGRPARGFALSDLDEVVAVLTTRGARVEAPNHQTTEAPRAARSAPLVATLHNGHAYYTMQALADYFGVAQATMRKRLDACGLAYRLVNLGSSSAGGRPRRGLPQSAIGDVKLAMEGGFEFHTPEQRIEARQDGLADGMKAQAIADTVPSAAAPVNGVNPRGRALLSNPAFVEALNDALVFADQRLQKTPQEQAASDAFTAELERNARRLEEERRTLTEYIPLTESSWRAVLADARRAYVMNPGEPVHPQAVGGEDPVSSELDTIAARATGNGLGHLVPGDWVAATRQEWAQEWQRMRAQREPVIRALREFLHERMTGPDISVAMVDVAAMITVFATAQPTLREVLDLRDEIGHHHRIKTAVQNLRMPEYMAVPEYQRRRAELSAAWISHAAGLGLPGDQLQPWVDLAQPA